jgi:hypothetical protein
MSNVSIGGIMSNVSTGRIMSKGSTGGMMSNVSTGGSTRTHVGLIPSQQQSTGRHVAPLEHMLS